MRKAVGPQRFGVVNNKLGSEEARKMSVLDSVYWCLCSAVWTAYLRRKYAGKVE
jgi:hypothetical protein